MTDFWPFLAIFRAMFRLPSELYPTPWNLYRASHFRSEPVQKFFEMVQHFLKSFHLFQFWNYWCTIWFQIASSCSDAARAGSILNFYVHQVSHLCTKCLTPWNYDIFCENEIHNIKKMLYVWFIDNIICSEGI